MGTIRRNLKVYRNWSERSTRMPSVSETIDPPTINGWTRPKRRRGVRLRSFFEQFRLYCENSSLNGCKYFTEPGRHWTERIIWLLVYAVMICGVAYVVFDVYAEYVKSPFITTEDKDQYPLTSVAFPALALCTLNRISYKSASAFAESIFQANTSTSSSQEILNLLRYLGHLYDYTYESFEPDHETLHNMLRQFYNGDYDLDGIMKNLTPPCHDVILSCTYAGGLVPCSELFTFRKTQDGYCCTFNYVRESDEFIPKNEGLGETTLVSRPSQTSEYKMYVDPALFAAVWFRLVLVGLKPHKTREKLEDVWAMNFRAVGYNRTGYRSKVLLPKGPGVQNGLSILIEPLLDDYFYTIPSGRGWKVILFNSEDYPDYPSGGVIEQIISPSTETYLRLDAIVFCTPDEIISYPVQKRKCIFNTELQKLFTGYTYSDCIVNCRVEDIWQTCDCLPFFFPKRDKRRTCDITDLPCLSSNKSKRWVLFPHEVPGDENDVDPNDYSKSLKYESVSGIDCSECYPACNDIRYYVQNSVTGLPVGGHYATNHSESISLVDRSIVHVYFGSYAVPRLKQDVIYYWYELLSNIGGICGVFVGFSLISILELLFFLLLPVLPGEKKWTKSKELRLEPHGDTTKDAALYWKELGPTRRWSVKERKTAERYLRINSSSLSSKSKISTKVKNHDNVFPRIESSLP